MVCKLPFNKASKGGCKGMECVNNGIGLMWQWEVTHTDCTTYLKKKTKWRTKEEKWRINDFLWM